VSEALSFLASIAPLQSAITIASDGGARVKIDIPEEEMPAIVRLMLMRGRVLRITIEPEPLKNKTKQDAAKRNHKQSQWTPREESGDDDDP
jgi:hypothetical protein